MRGILAGLAGATLLSGCDSLRLHNAATEEITTTAKEAHAKIDHGKMLSAEKLFLEDLESKTEAVVTARVIAARDAVFMDWIGAVEPRAHDESSPVPARDSWMSMRGYIDLRASHLIGDIGLLERFSRTRQDELDMDTLRETIASDRNFVRAQTNIFLRGGGRASNLCVDLSKSIGKPKYTHTDKERTKEAEFAYQFIAQKCEKLRQDTAALNDFSEIDLSGATVVGVLQKTNLEIDRAKSMIAARALAAKKAKEEFEKLKTKYECLVKAANADPALETGARNAASLVAVFIDVLDGKELPAPDTTKPKSGESEAQAAPSCDLPSLMTKEDLLKDVLANLGIDPKKINSTRQGIAGISFLEFLDDGLKQTASDIRASNALEFFNSLTSASADGTSERTKIAGILFRALSKSSDIARKANPSTNAELALIDLAHQRFKFETANISKVALTKHLAVLQLRRQAFVRELFDLNRAKSLINKLTIEDGTYGELQASSDEADKDKKQKAAAAFASLADAWDHGRLPAHLTVYREIQIGREKNLALDGATLTARDEVVRPVVTLLADYGKSGLKSTDIARAVNAVLLGLTAYGVN